MLSKTIVLLILFAIIFSLGSALYYLVRDIGNSRRTVRALTSRTLLSIALFLLLLIAYHFGFIRPHAAGFTSTPAAHHQ